MFDGMVWVDEVFDSGIVCKIIDWDKIEQLNLVDELAEMGTTPESPYVYGDSVVAMQIPKDAIEELYFDDAEWYCCTFYDTRNKKFVVFKPGEKVKTFTDNLDDFEQYVFGMSVTDAYQKGISAELFLAGGNDCWKFDVEGVRGVIATVDENINISTKKDFEKYLLLCGYAIELP